MVYRRMGLAPARLDVHRTPGFYSCALSGPVQVLAPGGSVRMESDFFFVSGKQDIEELSLRRTDLARDEMFRLKRSLAVAMGVPPFDSRKPWPPKLPKPGPGNVVETPARKPLATILHARNRVYADPRKLRAESWTSPRALANLIAEVNAIRPDLLVISGVAATGEDLEYAVMKKAVAACKAPVRLLPVGRDAERPAYQALRGEPSWAKDVGPVRVVGFSRGQDAWLSKELATAGGRRLILIGDHVPTPLTSSARVRLVLAPLPTQAPYFDRVGSTPVAFTPEIHQSHAYEVVRVYPDHLDVTLGKRFGKPFAPHLYLPGPGAPDALAAGLPFFVRRRPRLTVAHLAGARFVDKSDRSLRPGDSVGPERFLQALAQIRALRPDLCLNAGNLVRKGSASAAWEAYQSAVKDIGVPCFEVLGDQDVDGMTVENRPVAKRFQRYTGRRNQYSVSCRGVAVHALGYATDYVAYLARVRGPQQTSVLLLHDPLLEAGRLKPGLRAALRELAPTLILARGGCNPGWEMVGDIPQFSAPALAQSMGGKPGWTGYFIHHFCEGQVVSSFRRLGLDGLYLTTTVPVRKAGP